MITEVNSDVKSRKIAESVNTDVFLCDYLLCFGTLHVVFWRPTDTTLVVLS